MAKYTVSDVKKLREETDAGMMDCKKALEEAAGNYARAVELVHKQGLAKADKKADRETKEGYIAAYVHGNGKVAALVELLCETDFVALNEDFKTVAKEIAMQVAAMAPETSEELLAQETIKRAGVTVEVMIKELSGKVGEKVSLGRFKRMMLGETT